MKMFFINSYKKIVFILIIMLGVSCLPGRKGFIAIETDTLTSGVIQVSADESFKPVIQEQVKVFTSQNPQARIIVHYKPEADCLKDLMHDSVRMVITTRGLTQEEENLMKARLSYVPKYDKLAYDAVAVILHPQAREDVFSMTALRDILDGTDDSGLYAVMDGVLATGTVRYLMDTLLQGKPLARSVMGAKDSRAVIDYVASHPKAVGFIGVSWIGDQDDPEQLAFLKKVKVAALECRSCEEKTYVKPYQANIALRKYPLIRTLYYIVKENYGGLGSGFSSFMRHEKGQLIFKRAYLMPAQMSFIVREARLRES